MSGRWRMREKREARRLEKEAAIRRIVIATPMMDICHTLYAVSMIHLVAHTMQAAAQLPCSLQFLEYGSSILPFSRQLLAIRALETGATHMLWIDSDMQFPPDLLIRLASHDVPIVAANCISRRPPYLMTARDKAGEQVFTRHESTGLEQVARVGFGVMYHTTEILRRMPMPWFEFSWIPEKMIPRGEDFVFCEKATAAGYSIHIDHDVSKQVKHVGTFGFSPLYVNPDRASSFSEEFSA